MKATRTPKASAIEILRDLPDDASTAKILYELEFRLKVQEGLDAAERGEVMSHEEAKTRLSRG